MGLESAAADVFAKVIRLPASARAEAIASACGGDAALAARVEQMLAVHEAATVAPAEPPDRSAAAAEAPGQRIGPYRLMQFLGEGGFGSVFMAEQEEPVQRKVALKIIKLGMDTRQVVARFEQERQALAMMDHPNIARVLDAGATETGRPYFVMELVRGEPITDYCDKHNLGLRERLDLFRTVCLAVQHAHTKGIIHRDIKPSNVLVAVADGQPHAKVIDFGIAKATGAKLTEKTLFTEHRQLIGTPEYMSPEQAEMTGVDIDTRSDVYSLGVLLYELLTGTTPFAGRDLRSAAFGEIQRIIREVEPPRPSTRLSTLGEKLETVAARRRTEPRRLQSSIRGELDWIVMKALEKDRTRRYETAVGLAADIGRYLSHEPVEAGPPSAMYRLSKLARRHRGPIAAIAAAAVLLVAGAGVSLWQATRARAAEGRAVAEADKARAVSTFLTDMLSAVDPATALGREVTVKDIVDEASARLSRGEMADQPQTRAALLEVLGTVYFQLGRYDDSRKHLEEARKLWTAELGAEHVQTLHSGDLLANVLIYQERLDEAEAVLTTVIEAQERTLGPEHSDTLKSLSRRAMLLQDQNKPEEAIALHRRVIEAKRRTLGASDPATIESLTTLADVLQDHGRLEEALATATEAVDAAERIAGLKESPLALTARSVKASILKDLGRYADAEAIMRSVVEAKSRIFGPDHPDTMTSINVLALTLERLGKHAEGATLLERASAAAAKSLGPEHDTTLTYRANLARAQHLGGELDKAEATFREVLEASRRGRGPNDQGTLIVQNNLALLLMQSNRAADAEPLFRDMTDALEKILPADHWMRFAARGNLGDCLRVVGKFAEGEACLIAAHQGLVRVLGAEHDRTRGVATMLADLYRDWNAATPDPGRVEAEARWRAAGKAATP